MFFGIMQLRRARSLLGDRGRPGERDLTEAMLSFRAACELRGDWPAGFAERADQIRDLMTAEGSIAATAADLSDDELAGLRDKLRRFVEDAERHMP